MSQQAKITEEDYNNVLSPVLTIKTPDESETIYEQDFSKFKSSELSSFRMNLSSGIQKTARLTLSFIDNLDMIRNHDLYKGCRVFLKGKKNHQTEYQNLFKGIYITDNEREKSKPLTDFTLTFYSMRHIFTHTIVNYERNVPFKNLEEGKLNLKNNDPKYYVGNIVHDIFTNLNILPNNNGLTLQERGGFTLNGIDRTTPLTIPSIRHMGHVNELFNQLQNISGFMMGDDPDNDIFFRPPIYFSKGHMAKLDWKDYLTDSTDTTIIIRDEVSKSSAITPDQFADVILAKAFDNEVLVNNSRTNNFLSLYNKDISVQVDFRTTKLPYLTFMLSKNNAGTDADDPENAVLVGFVATDVDNQIGPDIVADFSIPLRYIPSTVEPVTRVNPKFHGTGEIDVTKKYWIVLQEIGSSEDNTVLWWHDGGLAASEGKSVISRVRDLPYGRGSVPAYVPVGWVDIPKKYQFSHTFTTFKPILHISKSILQKSKYIDPAPVEIIQTVDGVTDSKTLQQLLGLANEYSSRIPVEYDFGLCSIPNNLIRPGYSLLYIDRFGNEVPVSITDITYDFTTGSGGLPFGTQNFIMQGVGYELSREYFNSDTFYNQFYCNP